MSRTFTVEKCPTDVSCEGGRFTGKYHSQAAKKVARSLFKQLPRKRQISFTLRETTQDSDKKEKSYVATKVKLDKPVVVKRGDVTITVKYEYLVKACA